ncbi:MAG: NAD(P) transhydrogenase subunit beta [Acidiferrobacteraceae bacterium]|nr:NAD(P) transhydrogenase subunit beta [Acidiferrobacteraceae bacterium]
MTSGLTSAAYIAASILFILSLGGLSHQESSRRGNIYGMLGMAIAIIATIFHIDTTYYWLIVTLMLVGGVIGGTVSQRVAMTSMPQLVAILHSLVGLAAVLIGFANYLDPGTNHHGVERIIHNSEVFIGVLIGAVTFTGSVAAFGKLQAILSSKPMMIPGRHFVNGGIGVACIVLGFYFVEAANSNLGVPFLIAMTILAMLFGLHMVLAIGGADMPVVISMLNSYSGWAAAATGFMLANDLLIITGALVGSSGAILSYIMCRAMNRRFLAVILGGFGTSGSSTVTTNYGEATSTSATAVAALLQSSQSVVVVPGYGMAVANAQHAVSDMVRHLRTSDVDARFAIHPVAGRMPGHMNVLLAEARVPYDIVLEMDEINSDLSKTDVVVVIGANDIVNPAAEDDPSSPIAGMPVLQVWNAQNVIVLKRSMATGYAGVDNPLFYKQNTGMLFGDARESIENIIKHM